jgi:hypothetical protein
MNDEKVAVEATQPEQDPTITSELDDRVTVVNKEEVKKEEQVKKEAGAEPIRPSEPAFQIKFPEEERKFIKFLLYGEFGTGKTTLAGTAQDVVGMQNVLNIDAEGGNKVLANRGDIPSITIRDYNKLSDVYEYLRAHCLFRDTNNIEMLKNSEAYFRGVDPKSIKKPRIYNTVIIDSLSEVARYCMYKLMGVDIERTKLDQIPLRPEYAEWNSRQEMMLLLVRKFRDLPMHVIFVCSRQWDKDEMNRMFYNPNIQGKLANDIQGFMDHVGYYTMGTDGETKETHRYLMLNPGITYQAKNRFPNFKETYIIDPIFQDIFDLEVLNKSIPTRQEQQ